jgi:2-amino-4-hydroxy-6-hydroxymethyldihydropteridine diphosphokinase
MVHVYLSVGSNLDNPIVQVKKAILELDKHLYVNVIRFSKIYQSKPLGFIPQPDFINAAIYLITSLSPTVLLNYLQRIEQIHHRKKTKRWGPRTLDLDLLLYGNQTINTLQLTVPHQEMMNRSFVLYPLDEIAPNLVLPNGKRLKDALKNCSKRNLKSVELS